MLLLKQYKRKVINWTNDDKTGYFESRSEKIYKWNWIVIYEEK